MKKLAKELRVHPGEEVDLKRRATLIKPVYESKVEYQQLLDEHVARLSAVQELLYATNRYAFLIIFQAMDAAGKDGCIKHVAGELPADGLFSPLVAFKYLQSRIGSISALSMCSLAARYSCTAVARLLTASASKSGS